MLKRWCGNVYSCTRATKEIGDVCTQATFTAHLSVTIKRLTIHKQKVVLTAKRLPFRVKPPRIVFIGHYKEHPRGLRETWDYWGNFVAFYMMKGACLRQRSSLLSEEEPGGLPPQGRRWLPALHEIVKKHSCFRGFVNAVFKNTLLSYDT